MKQEIWDKIQKEFELFPQAFGNKAEKTYTRILC